MLCGSYYSYPIKQAYRREGSSVLCLLFMALKHIPESLASNFRICSFLLNSWDERSSLELLPSEACWTDERRNHKGLQPCETGQARKATPHLIFGYILID